MKLKCSYSSVNSSMSGKEGSDCPLKHTKGRRQIIKLKKSRWLPVPRFGLSLFKGTGFLRNVYSRFCHMSHKHGEVVIKKIIASSLRCCQKSLIGAWKKLLPQIEKRKSNKRIDKWVASTLNSYVDKPPLYEDLPELPNEVPEQGMFATMLEKTTSLLKGMTLEGYTENGLPIVKQGSRLSAGRLRYKYLQKEITYATNKINRKHEKILCQRQKEAKQLDKLLHIKLKKLLTETYIHLCYCDAYQSKNKQ